MYGSGAMTGTIAIIIKTVPGIIPRVLILEIFPFCVVVLGTTTTTIAVLLTAVGAFAISATATTDFVFLGLLNGLIFFLLHFYPVKSDEIRNFSGFTLWNMLRICPSAIPQGRASGIP
jgi:hypothetical protein